MSDGFMIVILTTFRARQIYNWQYQTSVLCPSPGCQILVRVITSESLPQSPSPSPRVRVKKQIWVPVTNLVVHIFNICLYSKTWKQTTKCIKCHDRYCLDTGVTRARVTSHNFWVRDEVTQHCQTPVVLLNPKKTGGPRHFARLLCNAQSSRRDTLWLFAFEYPAHFDTKFVTPGVRFCSYVTFLYMHVGSKWLQNVFLDKKLAFWSFFWFGAESVIFT